MPYSLSMESSELKKSKDSPNWDEFTQRSSFSDEVLERVLSLLKSHKDRSSVSLVCKNLTELDIQENGIDDK